MYLIYPIAFTLVYFVLVSWLLLHGNQEMASLKLNELGDFIAGILGPIALIWLITGIFLQSSEMRANTKQLEKSRIVSEEALKIKRKEMLIQSKTQELDFIKYRQKIRSGYVEKFVYLDHDDAGFLRPPYKSAYANKKIYGDYFATISRERIIFSIRNFGISGRLSRVQVDDIYRCREEPPFQVKFISPFHSYTSTTPIESILDIFAGSRYKIVFEFDKSIEPRLETEEEIDFEGSIYLSFDVKESDGSIRKITQEVEYTFTFDKGVSYSSTTFKLGIADESVLRFYPTAEMHPEFKKQAHYREQT